MLYQVTAKLKERSAKEFLGKLRDGSVAKQRPDGGEIQKSMESAVVQADGRVAWNQVCFCHIPLDHERATVFDHYFEDMVIEEISAPVDLQGKDFLQFLENEV